MHEQPNVRCSTANDELRQSYELTSYKTDNSCIKVASLASHLLENETLHKVQSQLHVQQLRLIARCHDGLRKFAPMIPRLLTVVSSDDEA
jgi:hypothetical protein